MAKQTVRQKLPAISDEWRIDRFIDRAKEFTHILRSINNFIDLMDGKLDAQWSGQDGATHTDFLRGKVVLNPSPILTAPCPIPGHLVDVVIGDGIHEGGHCVLTPPQALELLMEQLPPHHQQGTGYLLAHTIFNILEDTYLEDWIRRTYPSLFPYIHATHQYHCPERKQKRVFGQLKKKPIMPAMLAAFMVISILHAPMPKDLSFAITRRLKYLERMADRVLQKDRPEERVALAIEVWQQFCRWYPDELAAKRSPRSKALLAQPCCGLEKPKKRLPADLAGAIVVELLGEPAAGPIVPEEVTTAIRGLAEGQAVSCTEVVQASYDPEQVQALRDKVFPYMQQLNAAFEMAHIRGKQIIRGLPSGRLSRRRLERIVYDSRVFEQRLTQRSLDLALFVLLDASSSVERDWPLVEELCCAIVEALKGKPEVHLEVAAYQGDGGCRVTRLYSSRTRQLCLVGVAPSGRTPTGEALLAAGLLLQAIRKRTKVILHCTDGDPDRIDTVRVAVSQLEQRGIGVITISTQQENRSLLEDCYKGRFQTIASLADLPSAVSELLRTLFPEAA